MSLEMRELVANTAIFQNPEAQKPQLTATRPDGEFLISTDVIAALYQIYHLFGIKFLITSLCSDHGDDSCLGPDSHEAGHAIDGWFLDSSNPTDYMDPNNPNFPVYLNRLKSIGNIKSVGLGGSAATPGLFDVLGPLGFADDGSDHLHLGVR